MHLHLHLHSSARSAGVDQQAQAEAEAHHTQPQDHGTQRTANKDEVVQRRSSPAGTLVWQLGCCLRVFDKDSVLCALCFCFNVYIYIYYLHLHLHLHLHVNNKCTLRSCALEMDMII